MSRFGMRDAGGIAVLSMVLCAMPARALPPDQVSWTAQAVCDYRAIGANHVDPALRNRDTLAAKLCKPLRLPYDYTAARAVIDDNPEAYAGFFFVNARTRHIDEVLDHAVAGGATQVVILGAGFDSRAYRFAGTYPKIAFFEVDLPAAVEAKTRAVAQLTGAKTARVRRVPIDFDHQSLDEVLPAAGYDPGRKTLFILEGVSMYITPAGNEATFTFLHDHAALGSTLVFDYILRRLVDGDFAGLYAAASETRGVAYVGEPFVTGWTPDEAARFAERHGWQVLEDLDAAALTRRYGIGNDGKVDGRLPDGHHIIDAVRR